MNYMKISAIRSHSVTKITTVWLIGNWKNTWNKIALFKLPLLVYPGEARLTFPTWVSTSVQNKRSQVVFIIQQIDLLSDFLSLIGSEAVRRFLLVFLSMSKMSVWANVQTILSDKKENKLPMFDIRKRERGLWRTFHTQALKVCYFHLHILWLILQKSYVLV